MELTDLDLVEAASAISSGEISPVELAQAYLKRIELIDPGLNCFLTVTTETALSAARQAEQEIRRGAYRGLLHGIPIALKDLYETRGIRTTAGSKFFADYLPEADAFVVEKLQQAGTVLLGKLNMHEIALGVTNENPHYGACRNPWDTRRISGGSSGGSAAALVARLCLGSLGSDTGGSIRIPSSLCGVVGLKPTYGRVSLRGVIPLSWNLDHPGPMARWVREAAILLQAIAGYDPQDPASVDVPVPDYLVSLEQGIKGWRVAFASDPFFEEADHEILACVQVASRVFEDLGAYIEGIELPQALQAAGANGLMVTSDAAAFHQERMNNLPEEFGKDVFKRLQSGAACSSGEYVLARRLQVVLRRRYEELFEHYDILLTPTTPIAAPETGADAVERARLLTRFTAPFNLTGLPAISLPCGFTAQGLPIGMQLVARPWDEARLLQAAYAYEQATGWQQRKPNI
ncbi:MAG: amidase [Anaerolineales bacterium]|jgi:aspartyl-tRNA(Asn)/glutamyl-tRNA(Gln) amidotransferase subunit A